MLKLATELFEQGYTEDEMYAMYMDNSIPERVYAIWTGLMYNPPYAQIPEGSQQPTSRDDDASSMGLIIMTVKLSPPSSYKLSTYNPNTGEIKEFSTFEVDTMGLNGEYTYMPVFKLPPSRFWFSADYTKMGVTITSLVGAGNHAGLLDSNGDLTDITDRLGLAPKSDFADPVIHYMRGLTKEYLWFDDHTALSAQDPTYYVPLSGLSGGQVLEGCPLTTMGDILGTDDITPVLPLDDSRYVANLARQNSIILEDDGTQHPIVDTTRLIWNAVPSPDGTQIAFMSQVKNNLNSAGIYIVPTDGGEPQQIELDGFKIAGKDETYGVADGYSILIDWR